MKVYNLSKYARYSTIKDAYEAAVKDGKSCVLKAVPKCGGKPEYVIFPYKEWCKFDSYTFKDDGYKYRGQLTLEDIETVKAAERFTTAELAIERYVELGDIFNWIYKDDDSGEYLIDPKNTDALPNAGYKPLPDTRNRAIDECYKRYSTKTVDLSQSTRYNSITDAYKAADELSCVLSAIPPNGEKECYVLFPYKQWQNADNMKIMDDGYKYRGKLMPYDILNLKKVERFDDENKAIKRFVELGNVTANIYKDMETNEYIIDPYNTEAPSRAGYELEAEARTKGIELIHEKSRCAVTD